MRRVARGEGGGAAGEKGRAGLVPSGAQDRVGVEGGRGCKGGKGSARRGLKPGR